jgi:hypothetical protein
MESDYDPESEANAAMKLAVGAHGLERQKWFNLAIAWRELANGRPVRQPHKTTKWRQPSRDRRTPGQLPPMDFSTSLTD